MKKITGFCLFLATILPACKKDVDPLTFQENARINFFHAAHYSTPYIALDVYDTAQFKFPAVLDFWGRSTYPLSTAGPEVGHGAVAYLAVAAGQRRFFFTDSAKVIRVEKALDMKAGSYTHLYLTDSLLEYEVVEVPVDPFAQHPGKVRIRFINLVPDAVLNAKIIAEDGSQNTDGLPQGITYKTVTPFIEPDTARALAGNFYFRLYHQGTGGEELAATIPAVKATPGRAYIVVLRGYRNDYIVSGLQFKKGISSTIRVIN